MALGKEKIEDVLSFVRLGKSTGSLKITEADVDAIEEIMMGDNGPEELLSYKDAGAFLNVSRQTIINWVGRGKLSNVKFGPNCAKIKKSDLLALINQ